MISLIIISIHFVINFSLMAISRLVVLSADCTIEELLETLKLMKLKPKQYKCNNNDYYLEYDNPRKP